MKQMTACEVNKRMMMDVFFYGIGAAIVDENGDYKEHVPLSKLYPLEQWEEERIKRALCGPFGRVMP